ncbi:MAG: response regulator, partial [Cytophagales bacterium]|nr:response regulator [Cytophagales bacterium]
MGRFRSLLLLLVAWLTGLPHPAGGQSPAADVHPGLPLVTNYTPTTYGAHEQNWDALEGPDGRFYFANGDGLLVYDNHGWELIPLPNKSHIRSLGLSADSTLYVGGDGEFGYLRTDAYGQLRYTSLVGKLPPAERVFGRVWTTTAIGNTMCFQTYHRLFAWDGKALRVYPTGGKLLRTFLLNDTLYGSMDGKGLVYSTGKGFAPAPGGEYFADKTVRMVLPYGPGTFLVGTESGELLRYDGKRVVPFPTEVTAQLARHGLVRGCRLGGERFALALGSSGLYILDRQGRLLRTLNTESGLYSGKLLNCYADRKGNLWLGTQSGISKVALGEPLRLLDARMGLRGSVDQVVVHEDQLFVGTKEGLFVTGMHPADSADFRRVGSFSDRIWALHPAGSSLLIGYTEGVFAWQGGRLTQLNHYTTPAAFCTSAAHPGLVWASVDDGCVALQYGNGAWRETARMPGLAGSVRSLVETGKGEVWLGTRARGVYRLRFPLRADGQPDSGRATVRNFAVPAGLPPGDVLPLLVDGSLHVFAKGSGQLFTYLAAEERFVPDPGFAARLGFPDHRIATWYTQQPDGTLWLRMVHPVTGKNTLVRARRGPGGRYRTRAFSIPAHLSSFASTVYVTRGKAFFGGLEGVLVQDLAAGLPDDLGRVVPLLTGVQLRGRPVAFRNADARLPFGGNAALRVHFAAPFFSATDQVSYQTRLVGFEEDWSAWGRSGFKDYTNLWEGPYEFRVRAMDAYGRVSAVTGWPFTVTPPWYRRGWMYAVYVLGLAAAGYGAVRWRGFRLEQVNRQLEETVAERTAQLARQHAQLREQSEKLREMDRLKSQFFANISHEFRTPLTLIIGLAGKEGAALPPERAHDHAVILRNAHRLLRLINQLLELSRLEAGSARLRARPADLMPFLRQIAASFTSLAGQKRIRFTGNGSALPDGPGAVPVHLYFDGEKLEQVVTNLLSNAFKFTPEGGAVDLSVAVVDDAVEIRVGNTGPGIPAGVLPYVFDRFYQAEGADSHEGTGIGLALVKELVALHHGSVTVESTPGEQTTFTVRLPLGSRHLSPEERAETAGPAEAPPLPAGFPAEAAGAVPEPVADPEPGRPVVLVVEDHPDLRTYVGSQFLADYQVLEAEGGEQGWQLAETHLPDVVISDVMMPGVSGLELLGRLKSSDKTSHIPVILLTARAGRENRLEGLGTGADDYLTKPFDAEELRVRVRNLVRTRQQLREKFTTGALLKPEQVELPSQQQVFLDKLRRVLEAHLDDALFGVEQLGEALGMSRSQIHRKLKAITNQSPSDLIRSYRLQRAADLIRQDAGNLSEIAWQTGFSSLSHFSRSFHEEYGCS